MADLLSRLDLQEIGRIYMLGRATRITATQVDTEGSDANLFVGSMSFPAHAISRQLGERVSALLLDGAENEDLDRYAFDRYQITRKGASAAVGTVRFFRATSAAGGGSVSLGTKLITLGGIEYVTTTQATFAVSSLEAFADVRAVQAGKDFQVGKNQIRKFDNIGLLFDPTLQVNNDIETAGGEPAEEDPDFRERIRDFWRAARRGILAAIEFGALSVSGVTSAQASEALVSIGSASQPARVVNLYIADSSGVANAALAKQVEVELLDFRAGGIAVLISTSIPQLVAVTLKLQFLANVNTSLLSEAIRAAIFEFINSLAVNGTLLRSDLNSVLARFKPDGLIATNDTIVEPVGDLVPAVGSTLRVRLSDITIV